MKERKAQLFEGHLRPQPCHCDPTLGHCFSPRHCPRVFSKFLQQPLFCTCSISRFGNKDTMAHASCDPVQILPPISESSLPPTSPFSGNVAPNYQPLPNPGTPQNKRHLWRRARISSGLLTSLNEARPPEGWSCPHHPLSSRECSGEQLST